MKNKNENLIVKVPRNFIGLNLETKSNKSPYINQGLILGPILMSFGFKDTKNKLTSEWIKF